MMRPLRTAIAGFGSIADTLSADQKMRNHFKYISHAEVLSDHPAFDWGAVLDPSAEARNRATQNWGIGFCYESPYDLAKEYDPEILVITAPPESRLEIVEACPNIKGILIEKPLGNVDDDGKALAAIGEKRGIPIQVNYWRRAVPDFIRLSEYDLRKRVGKPQAIFGLYGNGLRNNGSHIIDFARFLFGEVASVRALGTPGKITKDGFPDDVNVGFYMKLINNLFITIMPLNFTEYREVGIDIWGTKGRLTICQESLLLQYFPKQLNRGLEDEYEISSDLPTVVQPDTMNSLKNMYDNFVEVITEKTTLVSSIQSALVTERVISAIHDSAHSGHIEIEV